MTQEYVNQAKRYHYFDKHYANILEKLNILFLQNAEISFLGVCPRVMKMYAHTEPCTQLFITSRVTPQNWKQPNPQQLVKGETHGGVSIL